MAPLTTQQQSMLRALIIAAVDGQRGYWEWRSTIRAFRRANAERLERTGLIEVSDGYVRITNAGRAALEALR